MRVDDYLSVHGDCAKLLNALCKISKYFVFRKIFLGKTMFLMGSDWLEMVTTQVNN